MASSIALKKLLSSSSSNLVPSSLRSIRAVVYPATSRLFNTNALRQFEEGDDRRVDDVDRRSANRSPFRRADLLSDVFDPFSSSTRSLSQILNAMDHMMDLPFGGGSRGGIRRGWDAKETEDGLYLRMDMPGLGKEDVKISVEQNTLVVRGEGEKEVEDDENSRSRFSSRVDIPDKFFKLDQIKAEMKNGVLKVMIPRVKEEERKDVINVNVE
ncbi:heat shock 22 kDa protein, mitochondrial [Impatiens glandulifera]|uniref:heat shock 22 kDa protein, mitochondrial n=1 Tax=Impatiens glandulifera TaxID=253017 RepID=UPI001FB15F8C|nr:heat shock 22 kDa protein, mitochondrial [Impatiens glandulifera]